MTGSVFNQLAQLDRITRSAQPSDWLFRAVRAAAARAYELVCLAFDWQWEWRQRAYERRLLNTMNGRERADIGLSPRDDSDESVSAFWRT